MAKSSLTKSIRTQQAKKMSTLLQEARYKPKEDPIHDPDTADLDTLLMPPPPNPATLTKDKTKTIPKTKRPKQLWLKRKDGDKIKLKKIEIPDSTTEVKALLNIEAEPVFLNPQKDPDLDAAKNLDLIE